MVPEDSSSQAASLTPGSSGQQLHVSGVFIVLLELALVIENMLPVLVVVVWLPLHARGVGDRLIAAFSITCILSALVPTPLGLASYFSGGWYGGAATCTTYQVTSLWCNLSSLALLTYMCVNCHFAVWRLRKIKPAANRQQRRTHCFNQSSALLYDHPPSSSSASTQPSVPAPSGRHTRSNESSSQQPGINPEDSSIASENRSNVECTQTISINSTADSAFHQISKSPSKEQTVTTAATDSAQCDRVSDITGGEKVKFQPNTESKSTDCSAIANGVNHASATQEHSQTVTDCPKHSGAEKETGHIEESSRATDIKTYEVSYSCDLNKVQSGFEGEGSQFNTQSAGETSSWMCSRPCQARDYVTLLLFFLYACTLAMSSLPVAGFGPRLVHSESMCRSWLVPIPTLARERTFFVVFLIFVYLCLLVGCGSGISVCMQVSRRMKQERGRRSRLYHEEEDVPDIVELSVLDAMKRQYSLTCIVMAGLLTWLPIVMMLTLQKSGVTVSEATLMYSNIATSLPGLLNPLLYSLALAKYRAGYKAVIEKCCCKRRKQKPHHLREIHSHENSSESGAVPETTVTTSAEGHTCLHGRTNPTFHGCNDVTVEEEEDEEEDEDYFPDDSELLEDGKKTLAPKLNEKTPLQAMSVPAPTSTAFRNVLSSRTRSPWQRRQDAHSACNDEECLLVSSSVFVNEETVL